jgi:hypothetical protein
LIVFPFFFRKEKNGKELFCQLYYSKMSHDQQPPLIWFHLFDSDGQPYKGSSMSSVSLPPASVINGFRQAVIDANPESSLDASQLKIYKNKTAFDGKEETLEDDCLVSGLGLSDKEALVVLVPTPLHDQAASI